ncbi:hypothetical protein B0H19DRAFT_1317698 [Mycena capillaripes]|nr:hypothetical protein B0H19DRAFT_1317698 [Mycena capillaripes]
MTGNGYTYTRLPPPAPPRPPAQPKCHAGPARPHDTESQNPARTSSRPAHPPQQVNTITGPSSSRLHHDSTTGRESALARRLQLSPAVDIPIDRPAKRRWQDDDGRDNQVAQRVGQTHGDRKRKRSPDSPAGGEAVQEPPLIPMRLATDKQRSVIFYAKRFQPASCPRFRDRYTFYYDTLEEKWRPIPDGMEPVIASHEDRTTARRATELLGLVD